MTSLRFLYWIIGFLVLAGILWFILLWNDPISRLEAKLKYNDLTNPMAGNGLYIVIQLPETAKPEEVVNAYLNHNEFAGIVKIRHLSPRPGSQDEWAALVDFKGTPTQILVFGYSGKNWHLRPYPLQNE